MKENGMNTLINLLNEYEIEREEKIDLFNDKEKPLWEWYKDCTGYLTFEPTDNNKMNGEAFSGDTADSVIISKSYGFIKRLNDNDKINFDKLEDNGGWYYIDTGNVYHDMLALLSIQDKPIEFLCSVLK